MIQKVLRLLHLLCLLLYYRLCLLLVLSTHLMSEYAIVEERGYAHYTIIGITCVKEIFRSLGQLLSSSDQV